MAKKPKPTPQPSPPTFNDMKPADLPDYMLPAWVGCINWALTEPDILATFRKETGNNWTPGRTPIDRMIDDAAGAPNQFLLEFTKWVNANIWGSIDATDDDDEEEELVEIETAEKPAPRRPRATRRKK